MSDYYNDGFETGRATRLAEIDGLKKEVESLKETLRDQFAMAALSLLDLREPFREFAAENAYKYADAMLEARKK